MIQLHVSYDLVQRFPGWSDAPDFFKSLLSKHACTRILEVGSGANPTLSSEFVRSNHLSYTTSDLNAEELKKADSAFEQLVLDLSSANIDPSLNSSFDFVLSRMVGEHVSNGEQYHRNIYNLLRPGGISAHCLSSLWTLPFAVNRMLPDSLTDTLLGMFAPRDEYKHGKFKAYYSWSRGPSKKMIRRFEGLGFEIISYTGYFGHNYYRPRLPWLQPLEDMKAQLLLKHPVPQLCSYVTFVLRKPS